MLTCRDTVRIMRVIVNKKGDKDMQKYNIKITAKGFGESKGTIHELGMSYESAKAYVDKMNSEHCYARWAIYEMIAA